MKKKLVSVLLITFIAFSISAQEKIAKRTYLYGDLKNAVNGKTLVGYGFNDPEGLQKILEIFKKDNFDVVPWNKYFMPGQKYSETEMIDKINSENIKTIIFIKSDGISSRTNNSMSSSYNSFTNSVDSYGSNSTTVTEVRLLFEFYYENFDKPVAVIKSHTDIWHDVAASQRGLSLKITKRVVKAIVKYN